MSKPHVCPICNGSGLLSGTAFRCHACNGTGVVWKPEAMQKWHRLGEDPRPETEQWASRCY